MVVIGIVVRGCSNHKRNFKATELVMIVFRIIDMLEFGSQVLIDVGATNKRGSKAEEALCRNADKLLLQRGLYGV